MIKKAFNKISKEEEDFYKGKSFTLVFTYDEEPFSNKGIIKDFNDEGIVLKWITNDPYGFCVGEETYENVRGSIEQLVFDKMEDGE